VYNFVVFQQNLILLRSSM